MNDKFPFNVEERKKKIIERNLVREATIASGHCVEFCVMRRLQSIFECPHTDCPMFSYRLDGVLFDN